MSNKQDITMYSDDELSLMVDNTESLYLLKEKDFFDLLEVLKESYIYTDRQLKVLKEDYENEQEEE